MTDSKKKFAALLLLLALVGRSVAADPEPGVLQAVPWKMNAGTDLIPVSTKQGLLPRWYLISVQSTLESAVQVFADGLKSNGPVNAAGNMLVFAKHVELLRYSGKDAISGSWKLLDPQKVENATRQGWSIDPNVNLESSMAMLDKEREFILTFDPEAKSGDCTGGKLKPIVDSKLLTDAAGAEITLVPGGSVLAKGKAIRATVIGTCNSGIRFSGKLVLIS